MTRVPLPGLCTAAKCTPSSARRRSARSPTRSTFDAVPPIPVGAATGRLLVGDADPGGAGAALVPGSSQAASVQHQRFASVLQRPRDTLSTFINVPDSM
jgi:hypothetical protein